MLSPHIGGLESKHIRIHKLSLLSRISASKSAKQITRRKHNKSFLRSRKRLVRFSLLTVNLALLVAVVFFVAKTPTFGQKSSLNNAVSQSGSGQTANGPLDQVSSADIAVNVAFAIGIPEADSVANRADSIRAVETNGTTGTSVASKPQVLATALPSAKDIQTYIVEPGDTISSIASKAGVSSDSVRWSNGLTGNTVPPGKKLVLPPPAVNGIVYMVKDGDTPDSLAQKYSADKDLLISFNDAEVKGIKAGQQILIPNGVIQAPVAASTVASSYGVRTSAGFAWGGTTPIYGRNGYDYGYCTYYVANRISVPANWGNADTWPRGARASGWTLSSVPRVGSIAQGAPIAMHVAYVEEVSEDGSMIKYSDMNNLAGWGRVGYSGWVSANYFPTYIYQ